MQMLHACLEAEHTARETAGRLAPEQAALRRVATLVATAAPAEDVFAAVTEEVGRLLGAASSSMSRYDPDGRVTLLAAWGRTGVPWTFPVGSRFRPRGP